MRLSFFSAQPHHCSSIKFHHFSIPPFFTNHTPSSSSASATTTAVRRQNWPRMEAAPAIQRHRRKDKVVVIMGATGTGKSRLSIDLATVFPFSEIINSDKMQVYRGLDITTNKIPVEERKGVPHHLLGEVDPFNEEFTPLDFRHRAGSIIADITSRRKLPIVVGGSNSFIHALLVDRFDPELNVFDESSPSICSELTQLRYKCCFLWVDLSFPVLSDYLVKRVDEMLDSGMVDELAEFFDPEATDLEDDSVNRTGLRKAIGVSELDLFFKEYTPPAGLRGYAEDGEEDRLRKGAYEGAVRAIKDNTCQLAKKQIRKILRLQEAGWDLRRLDATEAFRAAMTSGFPDGGGGCGCGCGCRCCGGGERWLDIWERQVLQPSVKTVKRFLRE